MIHRYTDAMNDVDRLLRAILPWKDAGYVYHATYARNLPSIAERGLLPFFRSSFPHLTPHRDALYFTNRRGLVEYLPFFQSDPAVLRVHRSVFGQDFGGRNLRVNYEARLPYGAIEYVVRATWAPWILDEGVIPEEIEVLQPSGWVRIQEAV